METKQQMVRNMLKENTHEILVIPGKCDGCEGRADCVEACKKANKKNKKINESMITVKKHNDNYIPILCHNCGHAPCVSACMSGARTKTASGWVETDYSKCVGCWMCIMTCPFGAIKRVGDEHVARKCEGCTSEEIPPCVSACKPGALKLISANELTYNKRLKSAMGLD